MVISPILNRLTQKHIGSPSSSSTCPIFFVFYYKATSTSQFSSVAQSCLTLCSPMNRSTPGLPVHHLLPEFTQTYAFVVDPGTKEPYGDLWVTTVHTDSLETYNIWFDTRVQGSYFYMYPRGSEGGDIVEGIPYTGGIIDALDLVEACPLPLDFEGKMDKYCEQAYDLAVDYGTLANITYSGVKQINYAGRFKTGHTYYVIIGELQGGIVNRAYFRFVYDPSVHTQEVALVKRDPYWTESSD